MKIFCIASIIAAASATSKTVVDLAATPSIAATVAVASAESWTPVNTGAARGYACLKDGLPAGASAKDCGIQASDYTKHCVPFADGQCAMSLADAEANCGAIDACAGVFCSPFYSDATRCLARSASELAFESIFTVAGVYNVLKPARVANVDYAQPLRAAEKIHVGAECASGGAEENLGSGKASVEECRAACIAKKGDDCKYFDFGTGDAAGNCWWEESCSLTIPAKYDVYQILSVSAWSNTDQQNCITKCMHDRLDASMANLMMAFNGNRLAAMNHLYRLNRYHNTDDRNRYYCAEVCTLESQNALLKD